MDNQCAYTDSNRAMAVCIGDKELSKALKNFEKDISVEEMNSGVVNSEMYKRQALHYSARKQHEAARKYLESGFGDYCWQCSEYYSSSQAGSGRPGNPLLSRRSLS